MHYFAVTCILLNYFHFLQADQQWLAILLLNQDNSFHAKRTDEFIGYHPEVKILELVKDFEDIPCPWTLLRILNQLLPTFNQWLMIAEEDTRIDLPRLRAKLDELDTKDTALMLGKALKDQHHVIHHHYSEPGLLYPDFTGGFLLNRAALLKLSQHIEQNPLPPTGFYIDPSYEFAKVAAEGGIVLTPADYLCTTRVQSECITHISPPVCPTVTPNTDIFVTVKTCEKFHTTRIPIIQRLWLSQASHITIYSDVANANIPTVSCGIPNTERGHCGKTMHIIKEAARVGLPWLVIVDDDTLMNLSRLRQLLGCYNHNDTVVIGQRYAYTSYDYPTGGSGMIFSLPAVKALAENCRCHTNDAPDDMILGICMKSLQIPLLHSHTLHQTRAVDYPEDLLSNYPPISFHKFWENDPDKDYARFLSDDSERPLNDEF